MRPLPPCIEKVIQQGVHEGSRDNAIYMLAVESLAKGRSRAETLALCLQANYRCTPPMSEWTVEQKVESAWRVQRRGMDCSRDWLHTETDTLCSNRCPRWRPEFGRTREDTSAPPSRSLPSEQPAVELPAFRTMAEYNEYARQRDAAEAARRAAEGPPEKSGAYPAARRNPGPVQSRPNDLRG